MITERKPKIHILKTWPTYFFDVMSGKKTFEIRKYDRDYAVGDTLVLQLHDPVEGNLNSEGYGGGNPYFVNVKVTYILQSPFLPADTICMGIEKQ